MAIRVVQRMLALLLELDDADDGLDLDDVCRRLGYIAPDQAAAWGRGGATSPALSSSAAENLREKTRKKVREDLERLRSLGFAITESRHGQPGDPAYFARLHLDERPFVPITLDLEDVASVVEWTAQLRVDGDGAHAIPAAAVEFGRAAESGTVVDVTRGDRSWRMLPWQVLLRGERCYGIGQDLDADMVRTLRLDNPDTEVTTTDHVLGPYDDAGLEASRMVDPLTWGDDHTEIELDVPASLSDTVVAALSPAAIEIEHIEPAGSTRVRAWVTDLRVAVERLFPVTDSITIRSPTLADEFKAVAAELTAQASWLPQGNVVPPMRSRQPHSDPEERSETLLPPGPGAPMGPRDSTSDTGALLLALNYMSERGGTQSITDVSRAAGRSPRIMAMLLATYLDQWLTFGGDHSSSQPFVLLAKSGDHLDPAEALARPAQIHSVEIHGDGLADIGRWHMPWQIMCRLLISALSARDSQQRPTGLSADLDDLILKLERRLGLDADQLTVLRDAGPTAEELAELRTTWEEWARAGAVLALRVHRAGHPPQHVTVHPAGLTEDLDLVALDASRPDASLALRTLRLEAADIDGAEICELSESTATPTPQDRVDAIAAVELTRLVTLAVRASAPGTSDALGTLTRLWDADIASDPDCFVAMIRVQPPVEEQLASLLVEHAAVVRVLAPAEYSDLPQRIVTRLLSALPPGTSPASES